MRRIETNFVGRFCETPILITLVFAAANALQYVVLFMARPPRIPVMLPWECRVIYFLTVCVVPRCNALANDRAWLALRQTLKRLDKWNTFCVLLMPDHIHFLTAPLDRELSVAAFLKWLKRWFDELYVFRAGCRRQSG